MKIVTLPSKYPEAPTKKAQELPKFPVPEGFDNSFDYLLHLTKLPVELDTEEYKCRLCFELNVIGHHGYADYFLIIWDLVHAAKTLFDTHVGPGRGSAAGSLVCYLLGITKVDPIKHNLLFERFIQPDRPILPDIDLDFETDIRKELLGYLQQKYGEDNVSNIITYNKDKDGNIKGYGIHACGLAIAARSLDNYTLMTSVDNTIVTALDGHYIEDAGVVKLDILQLSALNTIHNVVRNLKAKKGIDINIDNIPIDDTATLLAFKHAETDDILMFQSKGMKDILLQMSTILFDDLVALNALYRPGCKENLPEFIHRANIEMKNPLLGMEKHLLETYNMLLYQEQVMLLSRQIAGFSRLDSDRLRKALCKKKEDKLAVFHELFIEGGLRNGHSKEDLEAVWKEWNKQGMYLFNKSHAVCYTFIAYQMMYLKVHHPDEFYKEIKKSR